MRYRVWNFGSARKLPYKGEYIEMGRNTGFETNDRGMAETLSAFPFIQVSEVKDFRKMTLKKLRELASEKGIKDYSNYNKEELIKLLEVKINGSNKT